MTDALLLDRDLSLRLGQREVPQPRPGELVDEAPAMLRELLASPPAGKVVIRP